MTVKACWWSTSPPPRQPLISRAVGGPRYGRASSDLQISKQLREALAGNRGRPFAAPQWGSARLPHSRVWRIRICRIVTARPNPSPLGRGSDTAREKNCAPLFLAEAYGSSEMSLAYSLSDQARAVRVRTKPWAPAAMQNFATLSPLGA